MNKIQLFKNSVKKYIDYFGLWEYEYYILKKEKDSDNRASVNTWSLKERPQGSGFIATFYYNKHWLSDKETCKEEIDKVAFHEIIELLFIKLREWSQNNKFYISEYQIDEEIHRIIRRFENKVWEKIK